jgi:hypothetical protein
VTARAGAVLALSMILAACASGKAPIPEPSGGVTGARSSSISPPEGSTGTTENALETTATRTRFAGRIIGPLPTALRREMRGQTWEPGCPVPLTRLALLRFNHWGFDGSVKRGSMVVHRSVAPDVLVVFETLFGVRFPIGEVALAERFRPNADPDTRRSITAAFNCRPVVTPDGPGDAFSQHAYGLAVDINSLQNPYVRADGSVRNRFARAYIDRSQNLPGMIHDGDAVVDAFAAIGWAWGGHWTYGHDYMHFSLTGG